MCEWQDKKMEDESGFYFESEEDKLRDECGVIGIYLNKGKTQESSIPSDSESRAATLAYFGLYALQHRGQDSAGIAVADGSEIKMHKAMGTCSEVFNKENLTSLPGHIACGHVRYATAGSQSLENAQPMLQKSKLGPIALAHNGQLVNYEQLREMLEDSGSTFLSSSDTEVIVKLIAKSFKKGLER